MNKTKIQFLVVLLCVFYVAVSPYITVYQIKSAAERKDGEALSEYVDFVSLRQNFKDQMNAMFMRKMDSQEMKDNPFAMLGVAFAGMMVDRAVETYVTPAGITQLMSGQKPDTSQKSTTEQSPTETTASPFSDANLSYASFSKFVVTVQRDTDEFKFVLRRRGIGWKITEIILPLEHDRPKQSTPNVQDTAEPASVMLEEQSDDAPRLEQRSPTQSSYLPDSTASVPNEPTQAELRAARAAVQQAERDVAEAQRYATAAERAAAQPESNLAKADLRVAEIEPEQWARQSDKESDLQSSDHNNVDVAGQSLSANNEKSISTTTVSNLKYRQPLQVQYPEAARRRGDTGTVLVRILVGTSGRVESVRVEQSSGSRLLDQAALRAVNRASFHPYEESGTVQSVYVLIPIAFTLNEDAQESSGFAE